ncbi:hypothetical protein BLS_007910 [Venturia inaequalis]|uniref:Uncharacterized protein n=1 Tax=Venturia inaequalis TaxID=5025 RepID=A0A8H3UAA0_VENIN|nr:hypothetical protein BLS_007910 [Venturia inaequalis]
MKLITLTIAISSLHLTHAIPNLKAKPVTYSEFDTRLSYHQRSNTHILNRREPPKRFPEWNYANATTPDASPDGLKGIIFEPDLIPGQPGKDGGQIKKTRIGPITIPPGATLNRPVVNFAPPCKDCLVTAIQLGLEYEDGKSANVDSGAWCHHIDLTVSGSDYTCPVSVSSLLTLSVPSMFANRIFSGGNERTAIRTNSKSKYGLDIETGPGKSVVFGGVYELMSEATKPITVYMTLTWEFVPKSTPGYKKAVMVWLDVTDCARESGTQVDLYHNNKISCSSKQVYANRRGGYVEATDGSVIKSMVMPEGSHISDVGVCKDWGEVKKGDKLKVIAYYDDKMHMQMRDQSGKLEKQMGMLWVYMGIKS